MHTYMHALTQQAHLKLNLSVEEHKNIFGASY